MSSSDLYIPDYVRSEEEKRVYKVIRASRSRPHAMWCIVCGSWFKRKEDQDAALRALSRHCTKSHYVKDGLIWSNKPNRGQPVAVSENPFAPARAPSTPAGEPVVCVPATPPVALPPAVAQRKQVAPTVTTSSTTPSVAPSAAARVAPVKPTAPVLAHTPASSASVTPASVPKTSLPPSPAASHAQLVAAIAPPPSASLAQAKSSDSTLANASESGEPGARVIEAQAAKIVKATNANGESKSATIATQVPMEAEKSRNGVGNSTSTVPTASAGLGEEMDDGDVPCVMEAIEIPPIPADFEAKLKVLNKAKEVRKRGYAILPVKGKARQIAGEAQQMLFNSTGLLFVDTVFIHPADKESALQLAYGAVPDQFKKDNSDLFVKVWSHQQFLRADMAAIGYKFSTCRVRNAPPDRRIPPVEEWLEIRKMVSKKKKRAADAVTLKNTGQKTKSSTASTQADATTASPNDMQKQGTKDGITQPAKNTTGTSVATQEAATQKRVSAGAETPNQSAQVGEAGNRSGNDSNVGREPVSAPTSPMPQRHTTSTTSSSAWNKSASTARKSAIATGSKECTAPTARKTPTQKRRRSLRSEQAGAGASGSSKKTKTSSKVGEVIDLT